MCVSGIFNDFDWASGCHGDAHSTLSDNTTDRQTLSLVVDNPLKANIEDTENRVVFNQKARRHSF